METPLAIEMVCSSTGVQVRPQRCIPNRDRGDVVGAIFDGQPTRILKSDNVIATGIEFRRAQVVGFFALVGAV